MRIKLLKPSMDRAPGTVIEISDHHAELLISKGYAQRVAALEVRAKAIAKADTKGAAVKTEER